MKGQFRIDERRFSFIPESRWKRLSKKDRSLLGSYKSYYGHYLRNEGEINEIEQRLIELKEKKTDYLNKMKTLNWDISHLRDDFSFSFSIWKLSSRDYYNFTIGRRGKENKNGGLGSNEIMTSHLLEFYKKQSDKIDLIDKIGWKTFVQRRMYDMNSRLRGVVLDLIEKDPSLKSVTINRKLLFPLTKEQEKNIKQKKQKLRTSKKEKVVKMF